MVAGLSFELKAKELKAESSKENRGKRV